MNNLTSYSTIQRFTFICHIANKKITTLQAINMTQRSRCKKRLVKKYNTRSLHILRDHVRCTPAPRYNCPHLHFYFMLFFAPASHFTHPHLFHPSFPHPRSRRKVPNSAVWAPTKPNISIMKTRLYSHSEDY